MYKIAEIRLFVVSELERSEEEEARSSEEEGARRRKKRRGGKSDEEEGATKRKVRQGRSSDEEEMMKNNTKKNLRMKSLLKDASLATSVLSSIGHG